ncbi:thioredoxin fold domain-containing protein [Acidihalobacter yilgarnensis]|uniref:thioredoxin fold domain-containing protein n=1 Tax=Acidihalobacter yilgarnensis TaxID=2819280 RepID=UPI0018D3F87C|nr:thioredoxin fold domain-containing protein [Acidihalobacter yilgarnensis]
MSCHALRAPSLRALWLGLCFWLGLTGVSQAAASGEPALIREAAQSHWIAEGHGDRVIYVIFDPNCPYCHLVYVDSQAYLKHYQFRWVPVAILTPTSPGKAAAMLEAHDRNAALKENEDHFVRAHGKLGGLKPLARMTAETRRELAENKALLTKTGIEVVPTIVFLNKHGKAKVIKGAPAKADFPTLLNEVAKSSSKSPHAK